MSLTRFGLVVAALAALVAPTAAQSLYIVDGAGGTFDEITGPPNPALCNYPNGPTISSFPFLVGGPCPAPAAFAPPPTSLLGDIAIDRLKDEVYVTDGQMIGVYSAVFGFMLNSMPAAVPPLAGLTGLGFDSVAGILWMTDGTFIVGALPSTPGSCQPPIQVTSVFTPGFAFGFMTDIAWESGSGMLFVCDANGLVAGMLPGGAPTVPPWPAGKFCPALTPPLTGLDFDEGGAGAGVPQLYVTDGFSIGVEPVVGVGFPMPSFYTPSICYNVPGPPTQGLAYAARPITYGNGTDPSGLAPPTIGALGQSVLPNPGFAITLMGAMPNSTAWLVVGTAPACPPLTFKSNNWYVNPFLLAFGPFPVFASGTVFLPAPLGPPSPSYPVSTSSYLQWMVQKADGTWQASEGMELTLSFP